jgi:hypothetical protein
LARFPDVYASISPVGVATLSDFAGGGEASRVIAPHFGVAGGKLSNPAVAARGVVGYSESLGEPARSDVTRAHDADSSFPVDPVRTVVDCIDDARVRDLYIDMVKRCVINIPYVDAELNPIQPFGKVRKAIIGASLLGNVQLAHRRRGDYVQRMAGHDYSDIAHSMLSMARLDNIQMCVEAVLRDNIPGDLVETGVMRGGAIILMSAVLAAHDAKDRVVWAADSFAGLPAPQADKYPEDRDAEWHLRPLTEVSVEHVQRNLDRYGLLDDRVRFIVGWFRDSLPSAPVERIAVLRLDGDLYESTMDSLAPLYPKVEPGGFVIVDDYNLPACRKAVEDYRHEYGIEDQIIPIDDAGVYWRRSASG